MPQESDVPAVQLSPEQHQCASPAVQIIGPPVYDSLAKHQICEQTWTYQPILVELHRWRDIFVSEFKLALQPTAFRIGGAKANCYGHFRPGHNHFGLTREIALNEQHLIARIGAGEFWKVLGTLLHELLHAWQCDHGHFSKWRPHNCEFRKKAESVGLLVSPNGVTDYAPESPFLTLLQKNEIVVPSVSLPKEQSSPGSKLKKWSCSCIPPVNVRVAITPFQARCLCCNTDFQRRDD